MSKFSFARLISMTCWLSLFSVGMSNIAQAAPIQVSLTTSPEIDTIKPYEAEATTAQQPVKLTLQAIDHNGKPVTNVRMKVKLLAPTPTPWFTTDFPIVEGTKLIELQADVPTGKLELQQMFPIRGNYQLQVTTTLIGVTEGETSQQNIALTIPENSIKYQNFAILAAILAVAGLGGGWVIGGRQTTTAGEIAPQPVRLLLSGATLVAIVALLYVNVSAEMAQTGMSEPMSHMMGKGHEQMTSAEHTHKSTPANSIVSQGIKLAITGDDNATVGKPANFQVKAIDANTNQPVAGMIGIQTINTEKEDKWTAFGYQGMISNGGFTWQSGLFDGSGHQINVEFTPAAVAGKKIAPMKVSQSVEVEGVAPPLYIRLISLGYMTGIVASAFLLGFWLHRRHDDRLSSVA
jgi:hypothetical protein